MDVSKVREDFPTIQNAHGIYLDSACQSLRPRAVMDSIMEYYSEYPACGGRGAHWMTAQVDRRIDETRESLSRFFNGECCNSFVFTKNCTEGINLIASGLELGSDDVVLTSAFEHNSNHVPWLRASKEHGVKRRTVKGTVDGSFDMDDFKRKMDRNVRLVSIGHVSNVTGQEAPLKEIVEVAHDYGALVLADGSQAAPHIKVDFDRLDVDFYSASIHKMLGPTGMGFLYGKMEHLRKLRPLAVGGGSVGDTNMDSASYAECPERFEYGLQNYSGIIGTKAAIDYLEGVGMENVKKHDNSLMRTLFDEIRDFEGIRIFGSTDPGKRCGIFTFSLDGMPSYDVGTMMDEMSRIMVRTGMLCSHPTFKAWNSNGAVRASTYIYNNEDEIRTFICTLKRIRDIFATH